MGKQDRTKAATVVYFAAWCALMLHVQPKAIVMENSDRWQQDADLILPIFSDVYCVSWTILRNPDFGFPVRRSRFWAVLLHKRIVGAATFNLRNVISLFQRDCAIGYLDMLETDADELLDELTWSMGRANSRLANESPAAAILTLDHPWRASLTSTEHNWLCKYENCIAAGSPCMLNQNPSPGVDRGIHGTPQEMHCIIRKASIHFISGVAGLNRWLTPRDLLRMQGFRLTLTKRGRRTCSFAPGGSIQWSDRKRTDVMNQAGNSMCAVQVGSVWFAMLYHMVTVGRGGRAATGGVTV